MRVYLSIQNDVKDKSNGCNDLFLLILCINNIIVLVITYSYVIFVIEFTQRTSKLNCITIHHINILCLVSTSIFSGLIYIVLRIVRGHQDQTDQT